ncbi:MAG: prolipoprotein diacylglyceryl transferase [Candidatus Marinimicrobia bacterium]|nr:prolipoprotein diacylglyceryl transferase [Candidatus Neomarinimicrobiota bacterium]MBL7059797.1 prolipoprotein diacylglyceryl transferase [Candidatus Neomarinimicrobiota bacterium]
MIPVLFKIGPLSIYSFGFMLVVAFYSCYYLLTKEMKRLGYDEKLASDLVFAAAVGGILGSKIYYLLENLGRVIDDPIGMIFSGAGLVFLGGLIGGTLGVTWVIRKNNLAWFEFGDIVAPLLILGYAIGRIGCFLVGDDYGLPTHHPIGVTFEKGIPPTTTYSFETYYPWIDISGFDPGVITVLPTQLMETAMGLMIFIYLWKKRKSITVKGSLFFTYLILAGVERFFIEFVRTNPKYVWFGDSMGLSGAQLLSVVMIVIGGIFLRYRSRRGNVESPEKH